MESWQLRTLDVQLTQVAHDHMIVSQQMNTLQTTKNEEDRCIADRDVRDRKRP